MDGFSPEKLRLIQDNSEHNTCTMRGIISHYNVTATEESNSYVELETIVT